MEISKDDGEDTEEDAKREADVCSEFRDHDGFDNDEPDLEETLPPEDQGYPNYIIYELYKKLEVEKNDYELKCIVDNYFKDGSVS